eukprot:1698861-Lingulodinium_polyedra.AAC.1
MARLALQLSREAAAVKAAIAAAAHAARHRARLADLPGRVYAAANRCTACGAVSRCACAAPWEGAVQFAHAAAWRD